MPYCLMDDAKLEKDYIDHLYSNMIEEAVFTRKKYSFYSVNLLVLLNLDTCLSLAFL